MITHNTLLFFYYISFQIILQVKTLKLISLPLIKDDSLTIKLTIGSHNRSIYLSINQSIDYLWTISHFWKIEESSTAIPLFNTTIEHKSGDFCGITVEDRLYLKDSDQIVQLMFKFSDYIHINPISPGELGLPFKFNDERYSLVHTLKNKGLIGHLSYAIVLDDDEPESYNRFNKDQGRIYFGGLPQIAINDRNAFSCKVNHLNNHTWGCLFKQMVIEDSKGNQYVSKQSLPSFFQLKEQFIHVPYDYYAYLKQAFFNEFLSNRSCLESTFGNSFYIYCKAHVIPLLSQLIIYFDDITFTLPFCSIVHNFGLFKVIMIKNVNQQNSHWLFGYSMIEQFHTLFDHENKVITFYEKNTTAYIAITNNIRFNTLYILLIVISGLCSIGIFILFINNKYINNFILRSNTIFKLLLKL